MTGNPHNSFTIRTATWDDAADLAALTRELLLYERELARTRNELTPWAASEDELRKQLSLPNTKFFVAVREQNIVAYLRAVIVGLQLPREEMGVALWLQNTAERLARWIYTSVLRRPRPAVKIESGYIAGTFVVPDSRNLGIARALVQAAENWFGEQGLKASELHVLFNNQEARKMWEELGYEPLALGMRKTLTGDPRQ